MFHYALFHRNVRKTHTIGGHEDENINRKRKTYYYQC